MIGDNDSSPKVVRPFSSGPIWRNSKKLEIQEDHVSSSTSGSTSGSTNFAITIGKGKSINRTGSEPRNEPVVKCSLSLKNQKPQSQR